MNKIILIIFLTILLPASSSNAGWHTTHWGMTKSQIESATGFSLPYGCSEICCISNVKIHGFASQLCFSFKNKELDAVVATIKK